MPPPFHKGGFEERPTLKIFGRRYAACPTGLYVFLFPSVGFATLLRAVGDACPYGGCEGVLRFFGRIWNPPLRGIANTIILGGSKPPPYGGYEGVLRFFRADMESAPTGLYIFLVRRVVFRKRGCDIVAGRGAPAPTFFSLPLWFYFLSGVIPPERRAIALSIASLESYHGSLS